MRWTAPDGREWGSQFEYEVFRQIEGQTKLTNGYVRKTVSGLPSLGSATKDSDTFAYREGIRYGACDACGSTSVSKLRSYTPDIFYVSANAGPAWKRVRSSTGTPDSYYAEIKGYLRANKRSLLRAFHKARKDVDVRYILQRDYRVTAKLSIVGWIEKYLKCPVIVWNGKLPSDWV